MVTATKRVLPINDSRHCAWAHLTTRQAEVLRLVKMAATDREIADELVLVPGSVKSHLRALRGIYGMTRIQLAVYAEATR